MDGDPSPQDSSGARSGWGVFPVGALGRRHRRHRRFRWNHVFPLAGPPPTAPDGYSAIASVLPRLCLCGLGGDSGRVRRWIEPDFILNLGGRQAFQHGLWHD
jgi:hypothetical protein